MIDCRTWTSRAAGGSSPTPVVLRGDVDVAALSDPHNILLVEPCNLCMVRIAQDIVPDTGVLRERITFEGERLGLDMLKNPDGRRAAAE